MLPFLLVVPDVHAAPCRAAWAEIAPALDGVDAAWGVAEESFRAAVATVREKVPCLTEVLTPAEAARVHRAEGLAAFLDRDTDRARLAFAAARLADPAYTFPVAMVPTGAALRGLYDGATATGATTPLPPPAVGRIVIDGATARARPADRAVLLQHAAGDELRVTAWLLPSDPTPAWAERGEGLRLPLLLGAGAAAAGAGVLYGLAHDQYTNPPALHSQQELDELVDSNHALVVTSGGLGVLAVGLGLGAFVWGRW